MRGKQGVVRGLVAAAPVDAGVAVPYPASWVDALQGVLERLPWPTWVSCAGLWVVLVGVEYAGQTLAGTAADAPWPFLLVAFALAPYAFALMDLLDRAAAFALGRLGVPDDGGAWPASALHALTTKPALGTALATIAGLGFGLLQRYFVTDPYLERLGFTRSGWLHYFELVAVPVLGWAAIGALIYHVVRQVTIVQRLFEAVEVDVFSARRFHGFAGYSAGMAIGILAVVYLWLLVYPDVQAGSVERLNLAVITVLSCLAFVVFLVPLWGAHRRLAAAKAERLEKVTRLLDTVLAQVHACVESGDLEGSERMNETIKALTSEVSLLERASTWPWEANLFRGFATAVLLPMALFLAQRFIERSL